MAVYQRGDVWWYKFRFANRIIRESAKTHSKTVAKDAERKRRRELEEGYNDIADNRQERVQTVSQISEAYLRDYKVRHRSATFAEYALGHVTRLLGTQMQVDISDSAVRQYQVSRLKEGAAPKSINEEVGFLLRILKERGDAIRSKMRREKTLKLKGRQSAGKAYAPQQKAALLQAANVGRPASGERPTRKNPGTRSPFIKPALALAFNTGMRDAEIRNLIWDQIDFGKRILTVGKSKSEAGEGRTIPLNTELFSALKEHAGWYTRRFGTSKPEWFVFPGRIGRPKEGKERPFDPTRPVSTLKTSWRNVKKRAGIQGRWHDTRHTLITELSESGAGDQTIMDIAGHVSRQMLARYSHIRMEAKRKALEAIKTMPAKDGTVDAQEGTNEESEADRAQKWAQ